MPLPRRFAIYKNTISIHFRLFAIYKYAGGKRRALVQAKFRATRGAPRRASFRSCSRHYISKPHMGEHRREQRRRNLLYTAYCCCARHLQKVFFTRGAFLLRRSVRSLARGDVSASASVMCARGSGLVPQQTTPQTGARTNAHQSECGRGVVARPYARLRRAVGCVPWRYQHASGYMVPQLWLCTVVAVRRVLHMTRRRLLLT